MKKIKLSKDTIPLAIIVILSAILNFWNLAIEGTGNSYYAAAVKSMTLNFKNFFFVSFDPAGFVTIDKPPVGFWIQAISAKIFGFSGWSILLPQALAGVISVIVIYYIVKRSFGCIAGLLSALFLAVTPVFVAVSRNNTIDNMLVLALLLACWALSIAAEKGKLKYLILSMVLVGIGFNIKMLQAYMVVPALYITYLLSSATSIKNRIAHLVLGTVVLLVVSLSWALVVDSIPANSRPYVDSSTNNTVMELILGHNGAERLSLNSSKSGPGGGAPQGNKQSPPQFRNNGGNNGDSHQGMPGNPPSGDSHQGNPPGGNGQMGGGPGGGNGGGSSNLQGSFGGQVKSSITRLFSKNILSDQIVWFIPLALLGFIAAAIKENLKFRLDTKRKQSLVLWFMWLLPCFIYFSYNTGTFHSYYLTMLAPPIAALAGIGITSMWELYKEGGWKSWFLPVSLMANGAVQLLLLTYFINSSTIIKVLIYLVIFLCFGASVTLIMLNLVKKKADDSQNSSKNSSGIKAINLRKVLVFLALIGLILTPLEGSLTVLSTKLNGSFPAAGLELLSNSQKKMPGMSTTSNKNAGIDSPNGGNTKLVEFLQKNKTANQKYLLVVSNSNSASDIIINTGEAVMSLGGFLGNDKAITLDEFKSLVKNGEIRYVMTGGQGGQGGPGGSNSISEIMSWVQENGTTVSTSEYSNTSTTNNSAGNTDTNSQSNNTLKDNNNNQQNISTSESNIKDTQNSVSSDRINANSQDSNTSDSNSTDSQRRNFGGFGGGNSGQLYDLKAYTDSSSTK